MKHPAGIHESVAHGDAQGHLVALGQLLEKPTTNAADLFDHCLGLLVDRLKVDRAVMTKKTDLGLETFWWSHVPDMPVGDLLADPGAGFGARVMTLSRRTLVIKDAAADPKWSEDPGYTKFGIRAYLGAPLLQGGHPEGTLSVEHRLPKEFTRGEVGLLAAVANIIGRTLEIENLRHELRMTRDALELTSAVVEDSALQTNHSGLPNKRYLDIWLKANLFLAKRRGDGMAMALWRQHLNAAAKRALQDVAAALRGEDLLVDMGRDAFLLLLPRTPKEGTDILLSRIRERTGDLAMGVTLWDPASDDFHCHSALARCEQGLKENAGLVRWVLPGDPD